MEAILPALLILACLVGMGLMMFFMHRDRSEKSKSSDDRPPEKRHK